MKREYYLRGLGIGILVTALVFTFTGPKEMTDDEIIKRAEELGYVKVEEEPEPTINLKNLLETGTPTPSPVPTFTATPEPSATEVPEETGAPTEGLTPTEKPSETETPMPTEAAIPELTPTQVPTPAPTATTTPTPTVEPTATPTVKPTATPVPTVPPEPTEIPQATTIPGPTGVVEEVITADISVERGNTATAVCRKIEAAGIVENGEALKEYLVQNQMTDFINIGVYTLSSDMTFEEIANILTGR